VKLNKTSVLVNAVACHKVVDQYHVTPIYEYDSCSTIMERFIEHVEYVSWITNTPIYSLMEFHDNDFYRNNFGFLCQNIDAAFALACFQCEVRVEHEEAVLQRLCGYEHGFFNGPDAEPNFLAYCAVYPHLY
jgi:hypothetical protein